MQNLVWALKFPVVLTYTVALKLKNRHMNNAENYLVHQKDFFRSGFLQDKSDKFASVRRKISEYALLGGKCRALDIATGQGDQAISLKDAGFLHTYAIDVVPERVDYCRRIHCGSGIEFRHMDASALDFEDDYFDSVVVSAALHDMPVSVRRKVISEMARVAKGYVVIFEPRTFRNRIAAFLYGHFGSFVDESLNFRDYVSEDLDSVLVDSGLKVVSEEHIWMGMMSIKVCQKMNAGSRIRTHVGTKPVDIPPILFC